MQANWLEHSRDVTMQTGTHIKRQPFDKEAGEVVSGAHQLTLRAETGRVLTQTENKKPEGGT